MNSGERIVFLHNSSSHIFLCRYPYLHTCNTTTSTFRYLNLHSLPGLHTHPDTHTETHRRRAEENEGGDEEKDGKRGRESAELPGSQLLPGWCLLLAISCNCQFILSQAFHHRTEPGWRKPPESLRNLLATSH